jgi:phage-related protein
MDKPPSLKPLYWVGSSKRDLRSLPGPVEDLFGYALFLAQDGKKHEQAKPLKGFGSAGVLEVVEDWDRSTYRAVYTVRVAARGVRTPCIPEEVHARSSHAQDRF